MFRPTCLLALIGALALTACSDTRARSHPSSLIPISATHQGPALWVMSDEDTKITFFGTIHLLPEGLNWQRQELKGALAFADGLYLEVDMRQASPEEGQETLQLASAPVGETLNQLLPAADWTRLKAALSELGISASALNARRPWFASVVLGRSSLEANGFLAALGAEEWLIAQADAQNIPIHSLESGVAVPRLLAGLDTETQIALLLDSIDEISTVETDYRETLSAWIEGRTEDLHTFSMASMEEDLPEIYDAILVHRNESWVPEIERVMQEETGTYIVAVGSGHLIGDRSLIAMLKARGWEIDQF